jgi:hypothetical protein
MKLRHPHGDLGGTIQQVHLNGNNPEAASRTEMADNARGL